MKYKLKEILGDSKSVLLVTLSLFFIFSTILISVITLNKIEQGKYIGQEFEAKNTITVSGKGEIVIKPDLAVVNFSVISEAASVDLAMAENTEKINSITGFMKNSEIEERDLKTTSFRINPRYEWHNEIIGREERRVLVGYEVYQSLEVRIRDMEKIGAIIQGGSELGANQIGSLQFTVEDRESLESQARKIAIKDAKEKAEILSDELGVRLKRIVDFSEGEYNRPFRSKEMSFESIGMLSAETPEIEVGENEIIVRVNITYEIR